VAPFATPEQLEDYTKGAVSAADPRVPLALDAISRAIRRRCGWHIAPSVTETLTLDGPGGYYLALPSMHVTDVTAVRNDTFVADLAGAVQWSALGTVWCSSGFSGRYRGVEVDLTHGYALDEVEDLVGVVLAAAARGLSSPMGQTREQAGGLSIQWATTAPGVSGGVAILEHERELVDAYRIP
jgi:hypothetical protein